MTPVETLRSALAKFENYFEEWSAEHEDESCPGDDTCECPLVQGVEEGFEALERRAALEARRDAYGREHCVRYPRGGGVEVEYELGSGRGADYHAALEEALNAAGAP